jgi:hypothetical protein
MHEEFYDDYPREVIKVILTNNGNTTPYYQCSECKTEEKYILGKLENHEEWCPYRCRKESEILSKNLDRNNKIIELVQKHLIELESDDNGYTWLEYSGKAKRIVDFAEAILNEFTEPRRIPNIDAMDKYENKLKNFERTKL